MRKSNKTITILLASAMLMTVSIPALAGKLNRIATVPFKAEVAGLETNEDGEVFFNAQHPFGKGELVDGGPAAAIGYIAGVDFNNYTGGSVDLPQVEEPDGVNSVGDYVELAKVGAELGDGKVLGGVYSLAGDLMFVSNDTDYNAFVRLSDEQAFLYTAFEGASRKGVSAISRLVLNKVDGKWGADLAASQMIDLSSIEGAWVLCFGFTTPWGTEMLAEEYFFYNTALWNHPQNHDEDERPSFAGGNDISFHMPKKMNEYLGRFSNPYRFGHMIEMSDTTADQPTLTRHYAMGRLSHENGVVMADGRTVYLSDDDTPLYTNEEYNSNSGGVFFKFVADRARDMSSGTLYAAKATQSGGTDPNAATFGLEWIELAHGDNATIETWIAEYDGITDADYVEGESNYVSDDEVVAWAEGKSGRDINGNGTVESYPDDRPAFLESRKAAAALGATYEWDKMEGVAVDGENVYLAISTVGIAMDKSWGHVDWKTGQKDESVSGDIALDEEACGGVYKAPIQADYNITVLEPAIMGKSVEGGCDLNLPASPDNILAFAGGMLIGEDAGPEQRPVDSLWLLTN
ncbi:MAG: DUF839 domain-containing protein [Hyphomicrobiales bacterium]|nr:DUF839 domain-containing protein [Hyphomicrobiales bacterium]